MSMNGIIVEADVLESSHLRWLRPRDVTHLGNAPTVAGGWVDYDGRLDGNGYWVLALLPSSWDDGVPCARERALEIRARLASWQGRIGTPGAVGEIAEEQAAWLRRMDAAIALCWPAAAEESVS